MMAQRVPLDFDYRCAGSGGRLPLLLGDPKAGIVPPS
jgi:hypothetical protein